MEEKNKIIKCDFCGTGVTCHEDMCGAEKYICLECFVTRKHTAIPLEEQGKIRVLIPKLVEEPIDDEMLAHITNNIFPRFWVEMKSELKGKPEKKIAEESFAQGVKSAYSFMALMAQLDELEEKSEMHKPS